MDAHATGHLPFTAMRAPRTRRTSLRHPYRGERGTFVVVVVALAVAGCGSKEVSGSVPGGYRKISAHGASFAVPQAFKAQPEKRFANGGTTLRLQAGAAHVDLLYRPADATKFDAVKREYRVVFTTIDGGRI